MKVTLFVILIIKFYLSSNSKFIYIVYILVYYHLRYLININNIYNIYNGQINY